MQTKHTEYPVQHVGNSRHVSGVLKKGNEQKHDHDERDKADHTAYTADETIHNHGLKHAFRNQCAAGFAKPAKGFFDPALRIGPYDKGDLKDKEQDAKHDQGTEQCIGQNLVQLVRKGQTIFIAFLGNYAEV